MSQHHEHHHHHITEKNKKLFTWAAGLTLFFALLEVLYGFLSGSLMIVGDGVHMSSDAISLILGLIATILATKMATHERTFGFKRFEPIAAFVNGLTLILIPVFIMYEALNRVIHPVQIHTKEMLIVGIIGLVVNGLVGYILSKGESNLNMRSAMLHVIADMITSLSTVIVAVSIHFFHLTWLDPIGSLVTSIIIIRGGISITKEAYNILMEGTPEGYSVSSIKDSVSQLKEVKKIEEVKVWCVNEEEVFALLRISPSESSEPLTFANLIKESVSKHSEIPTHHIYVDMV